MRLKFTKMHGLGNDFVVLDATRAPIALTREQFKFIADRHFGIGCDQILMVEPPRGPGTDFYYRIINADGGEVEQCGNGARCFVRFVHDQGLTAAQRTEEYQALRNAITQPSPANDQALLKFYKPEDIANAKAQFATDTDAPRRRCRCRCAHRIMALPDPRCHRSLLPRLRSDARNPRSAAA